jgi:hypothetical protein
MERQSIIIVTKNHVPDAGKMVVEAWGSLTECCKAHGFPYHSLKARKYPFQYEDWHFKKVSFRALANER